MGNGKWEASNATVLHPVVLCIDRYKTLLPTVVALLTTAGYKVLTATNSADGLELAAREHIDALILDYTLCAHDHHSDTCVTDKVRALQKDVKIILWCADNSVQTEKPPCTELVFLKPVPAPELVACLNTLLRQ